MRWLGLAKRAVDIAADYAAHRTGFGIKLIDRESIQMKLGQAAMDIEIGRVMVMRAAWRIEQASKARQDISIAKIHVSQLLNRMNGERMNNSNGYQIIISHHLTVTYHMYHILSYATLATRLTYELGCNRSSSIIGF